MPDMSAAVPCLIDFDGPVEFDIAKPASPWAQEQEQEQQHASPAAGAEGSGADERGRKEGGGVAGGRFWTGGGKVEGLQQHGGGVEQFDEDDQRLLGPVCRPGPYAPGPRTPALGGAHVHLCFAVSSSRSLLPALMPMPPALPRG